MPVPLATAYPAMHPAMSAGDALYAMPYGNYQWDESARTVSQETQGYECRMSEDPHLCVRVRWLYQG